MIQVLSSSGRCYCVNYVTAFSGIVRVQRSRMTPIYLLLKKPESFAMNINLAAYMGTIRRDLNEPPFYYANIIRYLMLLIRVDELKTLILVERPYETNVHP